MKRIRFYLSSFIPVFGFAFLFLLLNGGLWGETAVSAAPEVIPVPCSNGIGNPNLLIDAIKQANSQAGHDIITLEQNCSFRLIKRNEGSTGLPLLRDDVTIEGNGATIYRRPFKGNIQYRLLEAVPIGRVMRVELRNLTLENGAAPSSGGAFFAPGSQEAGYVSLYLENVTLRGNRAGANGGGIHIEGDITIINSLFEDNEAESGGGLSWHTVGTGSSQLRIDNNTIFSLNKAFYGGGLWAIGNAVSIKRTQFLDNKVTNDGSGAHFGPSDLDPMDPYVHVEDSTFFRNAADDDGGGIYSVQPTYLSVIGSLFSANRVADSGGGIFSQGQLSLASNRFTQNKATHAGGVYSHLVGTHLAGERNAAMFGNVWDANEGERVDDLIMIGDETPQTYWIYYNTFVGRGSGSVKSIFLNRVGAEFELLGNIVTGYERIAVDVGGGGSVTTDTNLYFANDTNESNVTNSENNIEANPLFLDLTNGSYQLRKHSPAIDQGKPIAFIVEDILGNVRPQGRGFDLGAYESPYLGNRAPEAESDGFFTPANETLAVEQGESILNNDADPDYDALTAVLVQDVEHGELDLNEDGTFEYTPDRNFSGIDDFTYVADDNQATSEPTTVNIVVRYIAHDDYYAGLQDRPLTIEAEEGILANDIVNGAARIDLEENVVNGDLTLNEDGSFSYIPDAGFLGQDQFTYKLADTLLNRSEVATVVITVSQEPNQRPVAEDDAYSIDQNETLLVDTSEGVLTNDSDADEDDLEARLVEEPRFGDLDLYADGSLRYTPNGDFFGDDSFTYQATDGSERSETATVRITVRKVNSRPVAEDDAYRIDENGTLDVSASDGVLSNDRDANEDELAASLVEEPQFGDLALDADGSFRYTPDAGFSGDDSFTYQADDGKALSDPATVRITVDEVNTRPVAVDDAYRLEQDTILVAEDNDSVLVNDSDGDGDLLEAIVVAEPEHGVLLFSEIGEFNYKPEPGFFGEEQFTYQATDGKELSNIATVILTVEKVNTPPVAENDNYVVVGDGELQVSVAGVLANDHDEDGDTLTAVLLTPPTEGTLDFQSDGSFSYTPAPAFIGEASFTYQATDGEDGSESATVTITVQEVVVNTPPIARSNGYETAVDTPLVIVAPGVLNNDSDADGDTLTADLVSSPENGTLILNSDGSFTYEPAPGFFGNDSFRYLAHDGEFPSAPAIVAITVTPPPPPVEPAPYQLFLPIVVRSN